MLRNTAVDLLMSRLGNRRDTTLRDKIISEMAFVQEFILEGTNPLPWFLRTKTESLSTVIGDETITLPTGFLQLWDEGGVWKLSATGVPTVLQREDYARLQDYYEDIDTIGYYDLVDTTLYVRQVPTEVVTIGLWYYKRDTLITGTYDDVGTNLQNSWLQYAADWLMAETGRLLADGYLQAPNMAALFQRQALEARDRLMREHEHRDEINKERNLGG